VTYVPEKRHTDRVRPDPDELLQSLRVSLAETIVPALEDRWARYAATAMDLVLQHLQLRWTGELDALTADNADLAQTLAAIAAEVATQSSDSYAPVREALAPLPAPAPATALASATVLNETLRGQLVDLLRALDAMPLDAGPADAQVEAQVEVWRDQALRLVRREVDRVNPMVTPMYMSFSPTGAS